MWMDYKNNYYLVTSILENQAQWHDKNQGIKRPVYIYIYIYIYMMHIYILFIHLLTHTCLHNLFGLANNYPA